MAHTNPPPRGGLGLYTDIDAANWEDSGREGVGDCWGEFAAWEGGWSGGYFGGVGVCRASMLGWSGWFGYCEAAAGRDFPPESCHSS